MVRHAWPHVLEGSIVPFVLFALTVRLAGIMAALLVALGWSVAALARRLWRGQRVSGILLLSTLTLSTRTLFALLSGNVTVYFLPPLITTLALAGAFALSVPLGRPLSWRLANDLWPLPAHAQLDPIVGPVFRRLCWVWAGVNVAKAGINLWLLATLAIAPYALAKGVVSLTLMGGAVTFSYLWLRRALVSLPEVPVTSLPGGAAR